jgi:hypothetical protein
MLWFLPDAKGSCPVSELQIYFCFFFSYSFLILFSLRNYMYVLANSTYFTLTKVIYVWLIQILHPHLMPSCQIHVLVTDVIHVQYNLHCMATPPVSHVEFKFLDYTTCHIYVKFDIHDHAIHVKNMFSLCQSCHIDHSSTTYASDPNPNPNHSGS